MQLFQYKGRNQRGEAVVGQVEAATAEAVASQLFNSGVTPIDIVPVSLHQDVLGALSLKLRETKIQLQDQILFCRQMHTLLKAGVPIMQGLRALRDSTQNPTFARVIGTVADSLDAGLDLASAVKRHPKVFSSLFVSLVQVGESTGRLDQAFFQLAKYLELEKDTRDRIKSALRYPAFVMLAITAALFVINILVIPAFAKVYAGFNAELPWATKILIAFSNFMVNYWEALLLLLVGAFFGVRYYVGTANGRYRWHRMKFQIPIVGSVIYRATLGRFGRALSITIRSGVPLIQGLTVVSRAVDNEFVGSRILQMRDGVERGETIARTAAATGMFSPLVLQMITVGEESGAVDSLLEDVADYYEREVEYDLKNLAGTIEPVLIAVIAIIVLVLALGIFLPMWDLVNVVRR